LAAAEPGDAAPGSPSPAAADAIRDDELDALFAPLVSFDFLILAVSGGSDSIAMMLLVARWARRRTAPPKIAVATVDHALRADSRAEAEWVIEQAHAHGFEAALLTWSGEKPSTGIQDAARAARYFLLTNYAHSLRSGGSAAIVTAHTEDDQAETLLMRLARGSGLDGLAGMSPARALDDQAQVVLLRPLLGVSGGRLRATLHAAGAAWIEDPSNHAERFERVRVRKAHTALSPLGLSNDKIALSARRLRRVQAALDAALGELQRTVRLDLHAGAFASFDRAEWLVAPEELRLRLVGRLIGSYGGQDEPFRLTQLEALVARMQHAAFEGATLSGAIIARHADSFRIQREPGREGLPSVILHPGTSAIWDHRFRVRSAPDSSGAIEVRALGAQNYARLRDQLDPALLPAGAAATLPAFFRGGELILVPALANLPGAPAGWEAAARLYSAEFIG
jgi:tRNA(Ile)-lysidine synthase